MNRYLAVLAVTAITACATSVPIRWASPSDYDLTIVDNTAQSRFDITWTSKAVAALCLSKEAWPDKDGLPPGFDGAVLTTSSGEKAVLPTGSAYCPGGCGEVRLESGQEVRGILPYAAFSDSAIIADDAGRSLAFSVHPYYCTKSSAPPITSSATEIP
ncbi:hypothetical protein [Pseudoxanthomonas beigongshangi]|uniref:hypothetical protein n=1 Tax=Pseudoxanthomonas beigongshangi TaxID=2782537 RepID=UPI00193C4839|nr:hypothetical protein [Pseudoxanthomonas beigongshangi]